MIHIAHDDCLDMLIHLTKSSRRVIELGHKIWGDNANL